MVTVPKLWPGSTIVCLGCGPSLTAADVEACRGQRVIAINDSWRLAPWADVLYACDEGFWAYYQPPFRGWKFALEPKAVQWDSEVIVLRNTGPTGLERDPSGLRTGRNSGYQAINLAVHLGATRILLLGYDMQLQGKRSHWYGEPPAVFRGTSNYADWCRLMATLVPELAALGVTVINCSRETALTCFPRMALDLALQGEAAVA